MSLEKKAQSYISHIYKRSATLHSTHLPEDYRTPVDEKAFPHTLAPTTSSCLSVEKWKKVASPETLWW